MSVASMAGYLAKNGGGGQSTYYKTYSIPIQAIGEMCIRRRVC